MPDEADACAVDLAAHVALKITEPPHISLLIKSMFPGEKEEEQPYEDQEE
jgi:hypothetical protein